MKQALKAAVLGTAIAAAVSTPAMAADYTLRFAHFWPGVSAVHKNVFEAWADSVNKASNGRIAVDIYPGATLAKPPAQYDAVVNGIADMTTTVLGYTANRFPLTQIVELPGVVKDAQQGSCVVEKLYEEGLVADEFKETHPLFLFTHGQGHLNLTDKVVKEPSDLAGLRIRRPTAVVGKLLEGLGAQPVGMPAPESYQAMQRGVIDGVALPWEGVKSFRLNELANTHTEVGGLYSLAFIVTMNKRVYDSMPDDLKKVIDDNSGMAWANKTGQVFDQIDGEGRKDAVAAGHTIVTVEGGADNPKWKPVLDAATESYLQELEDKGLPARDVYKRTLELSALCQ
ncbi:TRAP transporter solute receptor, unknown substrate 3 [Marinobacterium lacunae]|uniref:TRAP-type C4-dicarboxylate transport system, periplasmic component n=1 Tax=Marinobacterium lacunae TaxID=1232683 RepID=A0A081G4S7_9GAMM|nr:TRAP transporter substrate-binding protein [Marinobacterium lacunae]KEA65782.1 TRAP transporter solute receptor, unknown substrate 3 [Marinobacterium lacunae]